MSYTPGPWEIDWYIQYSDGGSVAWRVPRSIGPISADHNHWAGPCVDCGEDEVGEANARLIAAAPELAEALKGLLDYVCGTGELNPARVRIDALEALLKAGVVR
jgi:hypothetical protein